VTLRVIDSAGRARQRVVGRRCPECGEWAPATEREWSEERCPTCLAPRLDTLPPVESRWLVVVERGKASA
jgi:hypothetical protein